MLRVRLKRSLVRIIASKKKVLEIQKIITSKRIKNNTLNINNNSKVLEETRNIQNYETSVKKLEFIESCIADNEYIVINLLKNDRYEYLSLKDICDELFIDFQREIDLHIPHTYMSKTG